MGARIRVSKKTVAEIQRMARSGMSAHQIGEQTGLPDVTADSRISRTSRQVRAEVRAHQRAAEFWKWVHFHAQGWSVTETAREFKVARQRVVKAFKLARIEWRHNRKWKGSERQPGSSALRTETPQDVFVVQRVRLTHRP